MKKKCLWIRYGAQREASLGERARRRVLVQLQLGYMWVREREWGLMVIS